MDPPLAQPASHLRTWRPRWPGTSSAMDSLDDPAQWGSFQQAAWPDVTSALCAAWEGHRSPPRNPNTDKLHTAPRMPHGSARPGKMTPLPGTQSPSASRPAFPSPCLLPGLVAAAPDRILHEASRALAAPSDPGQVRAPAPLSHSSWPPPPQPFLLCIATVCLSPRPVRERRSPCHSPCLGFPRCSNGRARAQSPPARPAHLG